VTKRRRRCVVGLATAFLPLVLTSASAASEIGAAPTAFNSLNTAPSGCKITNSPGNLTVTSPDRSMVFAMAVFLACTGTLDGAGDLNSPAFIRGQFSRTYEASSAPKLRPTIGIASCVPGGCAPESLLLTLVSSTGVLSLAPAAGGDAVHSSLGTSFKHGGGNDDDDEDHKSVVTPEPGSLSLLASGFAFMQGVLRRRSRKRRESAE
jgi:hypothetical protein